MIVSSEFSEKCLDFYAFSFKFNYYNFTHSSFFFFFFLIFGRPPSSPLFPYPPLSRPPRQFPPANSLPASGPPNLPPGRVHAFMCGGKIMRRVIYFSAVVLFTGVLTISAGCHRSDRKSTRLNSSHSQISYAVFCLKKKT